MPFNMPRSLTDNEVYALTAYILVLNKIIGENDVMDAKTLPQVKMPNRDNFIIRVSGPHLNECVQCGRPGALGASTRAASRPSRSTGPRSTTPITAS